MRRLCLAVFWLYVGACVVALAVIPATGLGLLAPNPFAALAAVMLAAPTSFVALRLAGEVSVAGGMALLAAAMAVNATALRLLCRLSGRRRSRAAAPPPPPG